LFVGVFGVGFELGKTYEYHAFMNGIQDHMSQTAPAQPKEVSFTCRDGKSLVAVFFGTKVELLLSDKRHLSLTQVLSASGARYANTDETTVFWNKGNTGVLTENNKETFTGCIVKPILQ
jgi:membrane-bound inhibitor of C-type lysozyme